MKSLAHYRNVIAASHDAVMAALSFLLAIYLRLGPENIGQAEPYLLPGVIIFTCICLSVFTWMRLYRGLWRYASFQDLLQTIKAVSLAVAIFFLVMFQFTRLENMPRSIMFINWLLLVGMLTGPRLIYRALKDGSISWVLSKEQSLRVPVVLVGAGDAAEQFVREQLRNPHATYEVVAIMEDNPLYAGSSIYGIRIYGGIEELGVVLRKLERKGKNPQRIILSDRRYKGKKLQEILRQTDAMGVSLGRLPVLGTVERQLVQTGAIQPVAVEDLLGRPQQVHGREAMQALVSGKVVLVTGAGGTIGSELCRQLITLSPRQIILYEQSEYALYSIDQELEAKKTSVLRVSILGDVRNTEQLNAVFADYLPQLVFHAAAIKHVPLAEINPLAAIATNILGTKAVAETCMRYDVEAMTMISTDKAVNPTNVMGATKRLAERYIQAMGAASANKQRTRFITVRFGNVLASTGSVVPLFQKQLAGGGPLTVTHPDMVRYFMTVREAVELVITATSEATHSNESASTYVLDMGEQVKIVELARQMIRLSGYVPEVDIAIQFTGLRTGEKLYEELHYKDEQKMQTSTHSIFRVTSPAPELELLQKTLAELEEICKAQDGDQAKNFLSRTIKEYQPSIEGAA